MSIFSLKSVLEREDKILFITDATKGLGDYSCAMKIANLIVGKGEIHKENILFATNSVQELELFNERKFECFPLAELNEAYQKYKFVLQIIVPVSRSHGLKKYYDEMGGVKTLCLYEYGEASSNATSSWLTSYKVASLGLGKEEIGICLSNEFIENPQTNIPQCVKGLPMGKLCDFIHQCDQGSLMYFGYANSTNSQLFRETFIDVVLDNKRDKDLIFILPGKPIADEKIQTLIQSFGTIKTFHYDDEKSKEHKGKGEGKKSLSIVTGRLPPKIFQTLLFASEKDCLVTGDQSLSEAICANKHFFYEALGHKSNLVESLKPFYQDSPYRSIFWNFDTPLTKNNMEIIFKNKINYGTVNKKIYEDHNCYEEIYKKIRELFSVK